MTFGRIGRPGGFRFAGLPRAGAGLVAAVFFSLGCSPKTASDLHYEVQVTFNTGPANVVRALRADGPLLWVGTSTGLLKVDRKSGNLLDTYTQASGLTSNYIFTINVDSAGARWFGTDAGGLMRLNSSGWKAYDTPEGLSDPWVYDIAFHPDGSVWAATWNGVSRFDSKAPEGSQFTTYNTNDGLANKWVYGLSIDRDRSLWFGTEEGVNRFDPSAPKGKQWTAYTHKDGLGAPNEEALARKKTIGEAFEAQKEEAGIELAPGRSYAGHFHDLGVLDEQGKETYNENYIFTIAIDSRGEKWFGTWGGGVSRFDGKRWTNYTTREGLSGNIVYALEIDSSGALWAGTNHGLSRFDGKGWKSYKKSDGLISDDVYAIAADAENKIWVGQRGGVIQMGIKAAEGKIRES